MTLSALVLAAQIARRNHRRALDAADPRTRAATARRLAAAREALAQCVRTR